MQLNNPSHFANQFLSKFLENGFGMPKRDMEVYVLHLLLEDGQFKTGQRQIDLNAISLGLKLTPTRVRSLVYEVQLKYQQTPDMLEDIIQLIEHQQFEVDGNTIIFAIQNPLVKQVFENEISQLGRISDGSFGKHLVKIKSDTFELLLNRLYDKQERDVPVQLIAQVEGLCLAGSAEHKDLDVKTLIHIFVTEFVKTSGKETASAIFNVIQPVKYLLELFNSHQNKSA